MPKLQKIKDFFVGDFFCPTEKYFKKPERESNEILMGRVTYILDRYPKARDEKSLFFQLMSQEFWGFTPVDAETLSREWRYVQRKNEKLRWLKFYDRQCHSKKIARLYAES